MKIITGIYRSFIIAGALVFIFNGCSGGEKDKGPLHKPPIHVKVAAVKRGDIIRSLPFKGTVFPWKKANIGPEVSGRVEKIYKKVGDTVKKGQLLAQLDNATLELRLKQAEAALAAASAAARDARLAHRRLQRLYEKTAVSQVQLEKANLALEAAGTQEKSARANLDLMEHTLEKTYMRAPFDGIIVARHLDEGDMINPMMNLGGNTGILVLMDLSKVKILLDVPSHEIEKIKTRQSCRVQVDTLDDQVFQGHVYSVNMAADPVSKTFKVEIEVQNPGIKIKAGIYAHVELELFRKENVLILPLSALLKENGVSYVVLYNNGYARYRNVKTGVRSREHFEILGGLKEGQLIVVEGNYDLREKSIITYLGDDV